ncbi:MAG: hypothetical protein LV481_03890 [Methylacidiphilales bacterium]|nr:hypothetical protein [Candidatus Methylacidiphilales bacterium]
MIETLAVLPPSFWIALALFAYGVTWAGRHLRNGLGLPVMAVLGTVTAWYVGDALYNDYAGTYTAEFTPAVLDDAWWEVALFVTVFLALTPVTHRWINRRELKRPGQVSQMMQAGVEQPLFQSGLLRIFWPCVVLWALTSVVAAFRLEGETAYYFFPFLGHRADPWSRERIGTGMDSLLSLAGYLQMFVAAMFGIMAALMRDRLLRAFTLAGCLITWPYFIFAGTRNTMLVVMGPAILAWVFLRLRGGVLQKAIILAGFFLLINAWFGFVIANRSTSSITGALEERGFDWQSNEGVHHEGLNMYEELCWINTFIANGLYQPNWGQGYLAELANPIPRVLWPDKPLIGVDYAILRGQSYTAGSGLVTASISTGMIGQGVVNFGRVLGPAFAALLMSIWVAVLARLDLHGQEVGRIPLYGLGLVLTFNLGRDITLITLYTFVFGYVILWCVGRLQKKQIRKQP